MHTKHLSACQHEHVFDTGNAAGERSTKIVMWMTALMMVAEIAAGWYYNSMALLADGFHTLTLSPSGSAPLRTQRPESTPPTSASRSARGR